MLYFAYGSNMDPERMRERCPGARALGAARLPDHRLIFTRESLLGGGVASVEPSPGDETWGALWDITALDEQALDEYEGVDRGAYRKAVAGVEIEGRRETAMIYVAATRRARRPSRRYLDGLVRGARTHGLPAGYVTRLESLAGDATDRRGSRPTRDPTSPA